MSASLRHGYLLLNKKPGVTSFDSLSGVKKAFATGKVGHTGTLDKFASGLLLILLGRGVKLASLFENCVKEYTGTILFGEETDTLDPEGACVAQGKIPSREEVEAILGNFRGDIFQAPPAYSAVHVNGRRAHELSREGKAPEMKKRPVTVFELEIVSWTPPKAEIFARVSAGTYIRSLARDIALTAGSRAHLTALERTKIGVFSLEDAVGDEAELPNALHPLDRKLFDGLSLPYFLIDENEKKDFFHGRPLEGILAAENLPQAAVAGVFRKGAPDELLGVLKGCGGKWSYGHVFANS
jgi:tRNA pseudouridine55 synthase